MTKNTAGKPAAGKSKKVKKVPAYLANVDRIAAQAAPTGKGRGGQNWGGRAGR